MSDTHLAINEGGARSGASAAPVRAPVGGVVLRAQGISKRYGGVNALSDVSMHVNDTEVVALVGDNGAGKSTFAKIISGIERPDGGSIEFAGKAANLHTPHAAAMVGIQTVYQDLALCDTLDTVQNLFLGREIRQPWYMGFRLARAAMEMRAQELLVSLGARIPNLSVPVGALSGGQRQAVAICRAVLTNPSLVILDEPTAALGVAQRAEVLALIERLRAAGKGIILISHDMHDIIEIADRVVVFRLGRAVAEMRRGEFTQQDLVGAIMGASRGAAK
jgi:D-xylose transport system ATP-binding protein